VPAKPNGKTLLVWGGSSSVGACAVQMAIASGYEVATTASAHNFGLCKDIGAKWVFDHTKDSVVEDIVAALSGKEFGGAFDAISKLDTLEKCGRIITQLGGYKYLKSVLPGRMPRPEDLPEDIQFGKGKDIASASLNRYLRILMLIFSV
jgi:D-arabinose 1-dehydrogenase-like Zn-dependent alcohol dehydrogenase